MKACHYYLCSIPNSTRHLPNRSRRYYRCTNLLDVRHSWCQLRPQHSVCDEHGGPSLFYIPQLAAMQMCQSAARSRHNFLLPKLDASYVEATVSSTRVTVRMNRPPATSLPRGFGGLEVACWPLVHKFAGSHPAEPVGFLGRKNPQHAFLRRGSKAVSPMW